MEAAIPLLAAGGGSAAGAAGGLGILEILAGASAGFGLLSSFNQGEFEQASLEQDALTEETNARVETLKGKREANDLRRQLLDNLAANTANAGAAGIDISSGTVQGAQEQSIGNANRELSVIRHDAAIRTAVLRQRAKQLRNQGKAAKSTRRTEGLLGITDFIIQKQLRGSAKTKSGGKQVSARTGGGNAGPVDLG